MVHLGPQDSFKAKVKPPGNSDTDGTEPKQKNAEGLPNQAQPPPDKMASISPSSCSPEPSSWHNGSHVAYKDLIRKHRRNPNGPTDLYLSPMTTQQDYGWWAKDQSPQNSGNMKTWTHTDKHPLVNSEMTRFVDEMSLTDKEFSLY